MEFGLFVSVVAYDDGDEPNGNGPINAEIFRLCWEKANKPADMWTFRENTKDATKEQIFVFLNDDIKSRHSGSQRDRLKSQFPGVAMPEHGYQSTPFAAGSSLAKEASLGALLNETQM